MEYTYGIIIKHPKRENYGFPYPSLENVDEIMTSNPKEELLANIKEANIIPYLNDESDIAVGIIQDKKWIERKIVPTITDSFILNYPFVKVFLTNPQEYSTYLINQLNYLVDKKYISLKLKEAILALKKSPNEFINLYEILDYSEKRLIKYTLNKGFDLKQICKDNKQMVLQRIKDDDSKN